MKRSLFRIGPATTLAMAAAIAFAYVRYPQWQREAQTKRDMGELRAQIASKTQSSTLSKAPLPANLDTLWNQRSALGLSTPQIAALKKLQVDEAKQTAALKTEVQSRAADFSRWMSAHQSGATLSDIQTQSAPYSAASAQLAQKRREFWARALNHLTYAQRTQAEAKTAEAKTAEAKTQVNS
jgi:hypothetical protein